MFDIHDRMIMYVQSAAVYCIRPIYPDNFLVLSRINGSVVESLFSQLKFAAGGKLSSLNYSWARRAVMVKANVHSNNCNNAFYRDEHIDVTENKQ